MSRKKEEAIAAGIPIKATKHSMKRRKPWHDYNRKGAYMLTIVVAERKPLLGRLVVTSEKSEGDTVPRVEAKVELTSLGKTILDEEIRKIEAIYKMVEVWRVCIMPDHIHLIVRVSEDMPSGKHLGYVVRGFKAGCSQAWWRMAKPCVETQGVVATTPAATTPAATTPAATTPAATTPAATTPAAIPPAATTPAAIPPAATTPAVSTAGTPSVSRPSLFESGYNDLILLGEGQLDNWKRYLDDNPRRLAIKRMRPELFTTRHHIDIADWHCQAIGNRFLLDIPQKVAVIVHSAYSDQEYAAYKEKWLACGEAGGILVSASIATREKEVMREAMNRGYRIILLRENGFPELYKPAGESFDACSEGRLLQICPWGYHMEQRVISREQCLMLNRLVEYITNIHIPY